MTEFLMPSLGADMDAGTFVEWTVKPGERVKRGQVVAVVETQKGAIDVEIWQDGTLRRLIAAPGQRISVGAVLAELQVEGEPALPESVPGVAAATAQPATVSVPVTPGIAPRPVRTKVSPSARRRAEELHVDLATVAPNADGVITREEVERAAALPAPTGATELAAGGGTAALPSAQSVPWQASMRAAIAAAMARSKREIPHYYLATDIDVGALTRWLAARNAARPPRERLLAVVPLIRAVALALREVPELNGFWVDGAFRPTPAVHVGMAIAMRGGGLVAPALHDADRKSPDVLMAELADLIQRVRGGRLRSSEMADPTITVTSLGDLGVDSVTGVIYPPQVAIVGLGRVRERPWVIQGGLHVRPVLTATLSADHRASDGHRGAVFLNILGRLLQTPEQLESAS